MVNNLFDNRYATYGTFFDTEGICADHDGHRPRTVTPVQPLAVYGGIRINL